ncbi:RICIN domain-containing protein [Streptomyces sp. NPDC051976]|uniref:RICIN domain-containing protein n=1 Tax=Streptomyces sp. NPDC051976 TaxID=3154947 RepID=UPI00341FCFCE
MDATGFRRQVHLANTAGHLTETGTTGAALTIFGAATTTWNVIPTSDDYYRLQSSDSGRCADIRPGAANQTNPLGVVEQAGASAIAESCAGTETQKGQLEPVTGGYAIVNAAVNQQWTTPPA